MKLGLYNGSYYEYIHYVQGFKGKYKYHKEMKIIRENQVELKGLKTTIFVKILFKGVKSNAFLFQILTNLYFL